MTAHHTDRSWDTEQVYSTYLNEATQPTPDPYAPYQEPDEYTEAEDALFATREHDYEPRWDYTIRLDLLTHPLARLAQARATFIADLPTTPFLTAHCWPADLNPGTVALYCNGTYTEPVILINIAAHLDDDVISPADEVRRSVDHELAHAVQEADWDPAVSDEHWADEHHAEHYQFPL